MKNLILSLTTTLLLGHFSLSAADRTFTGAANTPSTNLWSYAGNWDTLPVAGDSLLFSGTANTGNRLTNSNDFASGTAFSGISFINNAATRFQLNGNKISLTGNITSSTDFGTGFRAQDGNTIALALDIGSQNRTVNVGFQSAVTINADIEGSGGLIKTGAGVLVLMGAKTFTGGVTLQEGILRSRGSTASLGSGPLVIHGGELDLALQGASVSSLSGTGGKITNTGTVLRSVTVTNVGSDTYEGAIEDGSATVSLAKSGNGSLTLTGTNTYTGATSVTAGTLIIDGSLGNTSVTVSAGATLGGGGTIGGSTIVNGTLTPEGNLDFEGGLTLSGIYRFAGGDLVNVVGPLNLNNNWTLSLQSGFQDGGSVILFTYGSLVAFDATPILDLTNLGFTPTGPLTLVNTGNSIVLNGISVIPEPSSFLLIGSALAVCLILRRRMGRS